MSFDQVITVNGTTCIYIHCRPTLYFADRLGRHSICMYNNDSAQLTNGITCDYCIIILLYCYNFWPVVYQLTNEHHSRLLHSLSLMTRYMYEGQTKKC